MKAVGILPAVLALAACGSPDAPPPSVQSTWVSTVQVRQGSLPATVIAYGTAGAASDGAQTLSEAQPGQITRLLVTAGSVVRAGQPLAVFALAPTAHGAFVQAADAVTAATRQRASTADLFARQLATSDQLAQADKALADARAVRAALWAEGAGRGAATLTAPFDGTITALTVAQGDRIQPGAPILTVARRTGIVVAVGIDPADRAAIRPGATAHLQRLSGGAALTGHVLRIDGALNPVTRMVDVDIGIPAGALLPGEAMRVAIETGAVFGWVVPHSAVVTAGGTPHVFQAQGARARAVPVRIALASAAGDVVAGTIDPHLPLIVDGAYQVGDGDRVRWSR